MDLKFKVSRAIDVQCRVGDGDREARAGVKIFFRIVKLREGKGKGST